MERVLLLSNEGRAFFLEPPNELIRPIENHSLTARRGKSIIRACNSEWCFWTITCDFEVNLYVYLRNNPIQIIESIYENQKRLPLFKRKEYASYQILQENEKGKNSPSDLSKDQICLPSPNWVWQGDWYFDLSESDKEGWSYAIDFTKQFKATSTWYDFVRRRKWLRKRIFVSYDSFTEIESPSNCEFVNDIAVGGWNIGENSGFLCVWILSNEGKIFFRENVSFQNPEGDGWRSVDLPNSRTAHSMFCSTDGHLWIITNEDDCRLLLRNGLSLNEPFGRDWLELNVPYLNCSSHFCQIVANENLVYALDDKESVYIGKLATSLNSNSSKQLKIEWFKALNGLSGISLSLSNQLWAIGSDKRTCFIGSKLDRIEDMSNKIDHHNANDDAEQTHAAKLDVLVAWKTFQSPVNLDRLDAAAAWDNLEDLATLKQSAFS